MKQKSDAPIIIENIGIEHFKVDKIDHENNFGALGIKELAGQLNIGANYQAGGSLARNRDNKPKPQQLDEESSKPKESKEGPKYTIKAKK